SLQNEKQLSVDPISLRGSSMGEVSFNFILPPINTATKPSFSVSSPTSHPAYPATSITARLRKAREDFNAFLEALKEHETIIPAHLEVNF
ncbi:hypothetical protein CFOL_v3_18529, partial [Cephalotus follicularis]